MRLRLFSDRGCLPEESRHLPILYPFWGRTPIAPGRESIYARFVGIGPSLFTMTESMQEADLAVLPADWKFYLERGREQLARQFVEEAKRYSKQVVVFFYGDSDADVPLDATVFRSSLYRTTRKPNEFALPSWYRDPVEVDLGGRIPIRPKEARPAVGFCGMAKWRFDSRLIFILRQSARIAGLRNANKLFDHRTLRARVLRILSKNPAIKANFIIRDRYWGGGYLGRSSSWNQTLKKRVEAEYIQNMVESDYIVCTRGAGNYSLRLYETLSCGRIPVFVDTDCVLPYDFTLDWRRHCVWVDQSELSSIAEKVIEFHDELSPQEFVDLQYKCRELWGKWLSPEGFFAHFHLHFARNRPETGVRS
jgi:hypothetical protein